MFWSNSKSDEIYLIESKKLEVFQKDFKNSDIQEVFIVETDLERVDEWGEVFLGF